MNPWLSVAIFTALVIGVGLVMQLMGSLFGPSRYHRSKEEPYECGVPLLSGNRERFSVHFYLVAILFILFDIETVFLIPWAVMSTSLGWNAFIAVFVFIGVIVFGLVYEWRRGALEWE